MFSDSYTSNLCGDISIKIAFPSSAEPIINDSEIKMGCFFAIAIASLKFRAYCRISLATIDIGVFATQGIEDFPALSVTVSPARFIPETTPIIPAQPTERKA
ncbi:hypothetical protein D3C86_1137700 [compost metagenome]